MSFARNRDVPVTTVPSPARLSPARAGDAVAVLALLVIYFLAGKLGLSFAAINLSASAVWPPTGIALGALLLFGVRAWPAVFAGAFLVNVTTAGSVLTSLGIATGNTLEAILGAFLVRRFAAGARCMEQARDIFKFAALGAVLASTVSATIGVASLTLGGYARGEEFGPVWFTWWLGDACGALIVTPLLLLWSRPPRFAGSTARRAEAVAMALTVAVAALLIFAAPVLRDEPLAFLCLPPLAWAAFRFGAREVAAAVALFTLIATVATGSGVGPFALANRNESLLVLQAFMATLALMTLPIAAVVAEEREARAREQSARATAEGANRAKDEFLAMLSHELRNPLQAIAASGALLRDSIGHGGTADYALEIMARQTAHLTHLVNDLLDVTSAMAGKITLVKEHLDLGEVVTHCIAHLNESGRFARHTPEVRTESVRVEGDRVRLEQIIANLVGNSLRYTPPGGAITVTAGREADEAVLRVADDGVGIAPELLPRVFDLFTQGERKLDRREGGLGVGLTLVRQLVRLHGGRVEAMSAGPGKGSEFVVRLPLSSRAAVTAGRGPRAHPARGATGRVTAAANGALRVVIIEDNADARAALRMLLAADGHHVHEAEDGEEGIALTRRVDPDVVLIDLGLPRLDGYGVARSLRMNGQGDGGHVPRGKARNGHGPRLIAVTGYGRRDDRERARAAGFDAHVVKPIDPAELKRLLRGVRVRAHAQ